MKVHIYKYDWCHQMEMDIDLSELCNSCSMTYVDEDTGRNKKAYPIARAKKLLKFIALNAEYDDIPSIYEYLAEHNKTYANIFNEYMQNI